MHLLTVLLNRLWRATVSMDCLAFVSKMNNVQNHRFWGGGVVYVSVCTLTEMVPSTYHTVLIITIINNLHT